ncbi:unnamed protein product [Aureobasidium mustum]|uniref:Uncharacterized protein n=1 Tax=Aureobasidium mustum TaxID=2773714 RepID=A0A9N8K2K4_9PEZI|nr:unnamed protein product [Aureobasidium mustum]
MLQRNHQTQQLWKNPRKSRRWQYSQKNRLRSPGHQLRKKPHKPTRSREAEVSEPVQEPGDKEPIIDTTAGSEKSEEDTTMKEAPEQEKETEES